MVVEVMVGIFRSVLLDAQLELLAVCEPLDLDGEDGTTADDEDSTSHKSVGSRDGRGFGGAGSW